MKISSAIAIVIGTQAIGCASIVNGQNQSVSVETIYKSAAVSGAMCKLTNNKGSWFITTPGSTIVQRSFEDLSVKCEKDLIEPGMLSVKSSTKAMAAGNIIFGGIIGIGVDVATGAAYDYPTLITVVMAETALMPGAGSAPAQQTGNRPNSNGAFLPVAAAVPLTPASAPRQ